jgi:hypothetical protein
MIFCIMTMLLASQLIINLVEVGLGDARFDRQAYYIGCTYDFCTAEQLILQGNYRSSFFNPDRGSNPHGR